MKKRVRLTLSEIRQIVKSEILKEEKIKKEKEDSLDAQVDRYFSSYEEDSKLLKKESFNFRDTVRSFLTEGEDEEKDEKKQLSSEDLDMTNFVNNVMRLVVNYDSLLEVRDTILKRAANYLAENYDQATMDVFKEELEEAYGVVIGKSDRDVAQEKFAAPKAGAAGPAGGAA